MAETFKKRFETPDEVRTPDKARVEVVKLGEAACLGQVNLTISTVCDTLWVGHLDGHRAV